MLQRLTFSRCALETAVSTSGEKGPHAPRNLSMPEEISNSDRRLLVSGHRLSQSITARYGLEPMPNCPRGILRAFAASAWSVVKSCATIAAEFEAYATATAVFAGCAMINAFKSFH